MIWIYEIVVKFDLICSKISIAMSRLWALLIIRQGIGILLLETIFLNSLSIHKIGSSISSSIASITMRSIPLSCSFETPSILLSAIFVVMISDSLLQK